MTGPNSFTTLDQENNFEDQNISLAQPEEDEEKPKPELEYMKSKCNLCEKSFTLIFAFQQHLKAAHGLGNSGQEDRDEIDLCSDDEDPADSSSDSSTEEFLQNVHQQMTELLQKSMCGGDLEPELQGENAERNDETEAEDVDASMQDDEEEEEEIDENKVVYE